MCLAKNGLWIYVKNGAPDQSAHLLSDFRGTLSTIFQRLVTGRSNSLKRVALRSHCLEMRKLICQLELLHNSKDRVTNND